MTKEEYEKIVPMLRTIEEDQAKVIWYLEAIKKGNPCITNEQKENALKMPLIDIDKIKLHDWSHGNESNYY